MQAQANKTETSADKAPKFRTLGAKRCMQIWSATVGNVCVAYGSTYSWAGQAFVTNRVARVHAYAYVERYDERGNRVERVDLFSEYVRTRTYAASRRDVKEALAKARAIAEAELARVSSSISPSLEK